MHMPRALLLDAGNTVVFFDVVFVSRVLRKAGWEVAAGDLRRAWAPANRAYTQLLADGGNHEDGWTAFMSTLLVMAGVASDAVPPALALLRAEHALLNLWRQVPEGLPDALATVRAAGIDVGIISNSEGRLDALFRHVGLDAAFSIVLDSHTEGVRKPDPVIFRRACDRLGLAASDCLYAGDLPAVDIDGARAAGLRAVLIDAFGIYPDYTDAPRFTSVCDLCDALLGSRPPG
jgi:putative hydrolase of the HAD superfamily